tara:strand:- start:387 stop:992 length:606 start_codon:yes stop_codon:yes gene_type:complete
MDIRKDIRVDWITTNTFKDRHERMEKLFKTHGFENTNKIVGVKVDSSKVGDVERCYQIGKTHAESLRVEGKVLILEDDVEISEHFNPIIKEIPENADALYLGTSSAGMIENKPTGQGTKFERINELWDKPLNMLGLHAIIYLSEEYKKETIKNLLRGKSLNLQCDIPVALDMKNYNIYSCVYPMFYQRPYKKSTLTPLRLL